jgi:hypothetical protein
MRGEAVAAALLALPAIIPANGGCWDTAPRCHTVTDLRGAEPNQQRTLQDSAKAWARHMAATGVLAHSRDGHSEIVGTASDWETVVQAFLRSPAHRDILLDPALHEVGIGFVREGDRVWVAVQFK